MPVAAAATTIVVGPAVFPAGSHPGSCCSWGAGPLALLLPVIPFSLELLALRRLKAPRPSGRS